MSAGAEQEYRLKVLREFEHDGAFVCGSPSSPLTFVLDPEDGEEALRALHLSTRRLQLGDPLVLRTPTLQTLLCIKPGALVALGPDAAHTLDKLHYPLALQSFADATPAEWFLWARNSYGILLPPITPALLSQESKKHFWSAFLNLKTARDMLQGH